MDASELVERRTRLWGQDAPGRVLSVADAPAYIETFGLVTHYGASSEVPSLFQAYMGDADAKVSTKWDSPSGHVYTWRWELGKAATAFYGTVVCRKPSWVSWQCLPLLLGFLMERSDPETLYAEGRLSQDALRLARAFEGTDGTLSTKDLRSRGGFPTGKSERAAYLKALEELELLMLVCKTFGAESDGEDMRHTLVRLASPDAYAAATARSREESLYGFLAFYLSRSLFVDTRVFARHLRVAPEIMEAAVSELAKVGKVDRAGALAVWIGE